MVLVGGHVVADGDGGEAVDVESVRITTAVDEWTTGLGIVAERDALRVAHAIACAGREPGRTLNLVAAAEHD